MAYISSNNNRWYCQIENSYGQVPTITAENRFPAVQMSVQQKVVTPKRQDKTGSRTFPGALANMRKQTNFSLTTYMSAWTNPSPPPYGPLFQAALGATPLVYAGGTSASSTSLILAFNAVHGLVAGQAVTYLGEIRFVASVIDTVTVALNAPFSTVPAVGAPIGPTFTYLPTTELPSVSIFDYWTPSTSVQRLLCGCAINQLDLQVNGDYQQFAFKGIAQDILDSSSFVPSGAGELSAFPAEPTPLSGAPTTIVPGHLGQAWLGLVQSNFSTLTSAKVSLQNDLDARTREFGAILPLAINPGMRSVQLDMELYGQDDSATVGLYESARAREPIQAGFQLGQTSGQLLGVYMKSVVPEVPDYDDKERRLQWQFRGSLAQGQGDDEIAIAFG